MAALSLVAALAVMAFADDHRPSVVPSETHDPAAFTPIPDGAQLEAAVRFRPAQLTQRQDVTTSKGRGVALVAALVALASVAPALALRVRVVLPARSARSGRSRSFRLRAPPALQLI